METRSFGRMGWPVSQLGYGTWGIGDWSGSSDEESRSALQHAVRSGINFFDTALSYGAGHSERLLGELLASTQSMRLYVATKIPPKGAMGMARPQDQIEDLYPPNHIRACAAESIENLGVKTIDLLQFHTWNDRWADEPSWRRTIDTLKEDGLISAAGISINRWQTSNSLRTIRTGAIDAVQVVYNIFDQAAEDELFPLCRDLNVAVIARVPYDEGSLTGTLTRESSWGQGDWRNGYFNPENLNATVDRINALKPLVPDGDTMASLALRFVMSNPDMAAVIPGMRRRAHVAANVAAADRGNLPEDLISELRRHRWNREDPATELASP